MLQFWPQITFILITLVGSILMIKDDEFNLLNFLSIALTYFLLFAGGFFSEMLRYIINALTCGV